jgi:hypothetical protein
MVGLMALLLAVLMGLETVEKLESTKDLLKENLMAAMTEKMLEKQSAVSME